MYQVQEIQGLTVRSEAIIFIRSQIVNAWFRERSGWVRGTKANKKKDSAARCRFSSFARTRTRYLFFLLKSSAKIRRNSATDDVESFFDEELFFVVYRKRRVDGLE